MSTPQQQIPWDFPRWEWAAQDADGTWWLFTEKPVFAFTDWKASDRCMQIPDIMAPPYREDWENTLTKRETYYV